MCPARPALEQNVYGFKHKSQVTDRLKNRADDGYSASEALSGLGTDNDLCKLCVTVQAGMPMTVKG